MERGRGDVFILVGWLVVAFVDVVFFCFCFLLVCLFVLVFNYCLV